MFRPTYSSIISDLVRLRDELLIADLDADDLEVIAASFTKGAEKALKLVQVKLDNDLFEGIE